MKATTHLFAGLGILAVLSSVAGSRPAPAASRDPRVEHGKYLVHQAAMCIDCHSPRNAAGEFLEGKQLTGAPIGFNPVHPMPWMPVAPGLAGLPAGYRSDDMVHFLTTGMRPNGSAPLPPMPLYRFNGGDAEAITAYLRSLAPGTR